MYKNIESFEWYYQVSKMWKVLSIRQWRLLELVTCERWYKIVCLSKNWKAKNFYVHRLVAKAFILNPDNLKYINHKDWNKTNNKVDNLEWCTQSYNMLHAYKTWLAKWQYWKDNHSAKQIMQYDLNWNLIKVWDSIMDICRKLWVERTQIRRCCQWKVKTAFQYKWEYA